MVQLVSVVLAVVSRRPVRTVATGYATWAFVNSGRRACGRNKITMALLVVLLLLLRMHFDCGRRRRRRRRQIVVTVWRGLLCVCGGRQTDGGGGVMRMGGGEFGGRRRQVTPVERREVVGEAMLRLMLLVLQWLAVEGMRAANVVVATGGWGGLLVHL